MSLIDSSYFIREISLPVDKYTDLQLFIDRYENRIINDLFGYELGKLVIAYDVGTSPQRIKDIVEGKEYMPTGETFLIKWNGLKNNDKESLIAYWVYYWWCREKESFNTNVAGAASKLENAENIGFTNKSSYAWHKMLQLYGFSCQPKLEPSCYNFLTEFKTDYPEWVFKEKGSINRFGT